MILTDNHQVVLARDRQSDPKIIHDRTSDLVRSDGNRTKQSSAGLGTNSVPSWDGMGR
jgi:hypothetical protein